MTEMRNAKNLVWTMYSRTKLYCDSVLHSTTYRSVFTAALGLNNDFASFSSSVAVLLVLSTLCVVVDSASLTVVVDVVVVVGMVTTSDIGSVSDMDEITRCAFSMHRSPFLRQYTWLRVMLHRVS